MFKEFSWLCTNIALSQDKGNYHSWFRKSGEIITWRSSYIKFDWFARLDDILKIIDEKLVKLSPGANNIDSFEKNIRYLK